MRLGARVGMILGHPAPLTPPPPHTHTHQGAFTAEPTAFTFSLVGDLPPDDVLLPLLAAYLGSLGGGGQEAAALDAASSAQAPALPVCGAGPFGVVLDPLADAGSCGCCPVPPVDGCPNGGSGAAADGEDAGTDRSSPWARPGETTTPFLPTPLPAVFTPGSVVVRAGRHTPDGKASCLLAWRLDMPDDPDADTELEMRVKFACLVRELRKGGRGRALGPCIAGHRRPVKGTIARTLPAALVPLPRLRATTAAAVTPRLPAAHRLRTLRFSKPACWRSSGRRIRPS